MTKLAFSFAEAAAATGISEATIRRAVRAGDLATNCPTIDGKPIAKPVIVAAELDRWIRSAA